MKFMSFGPMHDLRVRRIRKGTSSSSSGHKFGLGITKSTRGVNNVCGTLPVP